MNETTNLFPLYALSAVAAIASFIDLILLLIILRKEGTIMSQADDLTAAVKAAVDEEANLETRVDGIIAALKTHPDDPAVAQAIADLEALKSRETSYQSSPTTGGGTPA